MKKQYINPQIKIVKVRPNLLQSASLEINEKAGKSGRVLSRRRDDWEDEEYEDE